jgi:ABC-type antimicrobial peptide transport system permease subunit
MLRRVVGGRHDRGVEAHDPAVVGTAAAAVAIVAVAAAAVPARRATAVNPALALRAE